jgi:hypothetical protein
MNEIELTQKNAKEVEKENVQHQKTINILKGGLQRIFDLLGIEPDGAWDTEMLTHKRGAVLYKLGMLEYRAFELTQANLAILASQHLPNATALVNRDRFEAPDLLLPSLHKPGEKVAAHQSVVRVEGPAESEGETGLGEDEEEDYGEEYDDTRTFTVKDFKEQALRYAKDHFQTKIEKDHRATGGDTSHAVTSGDVSV